MKILKKISLTIFLIATVLILFSTKVCYAGIPNNKNTYMSDGGGGKKQTTVTPIENEKKDYTLGEAIQQAIDFIIHGKQNAPVEGEDIKEANNAMFNLLVIIGTALAVIVGGILGIQFLIASAEDKAKIKEALIPYIIGCVLIFGAFAIWKIVVSLLSAIHSV